MPDIALGSVPGGSANFKGYVSRPAGGGPWPGVVAVHEAWGLDAMIRRQADRMADAGYLTLAPDLFSDGGTKRCLVSTIRAMILGGGKPYADIEAARQWLLDQGDCTGRVGILGFCMGGGFALAVAGSGFDASAPNYGVLPRDLDGALKGSCPIVASYGAKDIGAAKSVARLEKALAKHHVAHDVKLYPDAGHSFLNDGPSGPRVLRPLLRVAHIGPEPASARDAWSRIEAFFAAHLGAPST
ncbi:MAG: dienelactone hydrolase family protein [Actinomycetota bacterium]|nr:dienelactone hydrolase family protein [Actinomycetota bacterium]